MAGLGGAWMKCRVREQLGRSEKSASARKDVQMTPCFVMDCVCRASGRSVLVLLGRSRESME